MAIGKRRASIIDGLRAGPATQGILRSCLARLQDRATAMTPGRTQDYIVIEMAEHVLGPDWRACCSKLRAVGMGCIFCEEAGGEILWEDDYCRAVWAYEADYPGLCRVIWDRHVKEMTDLDADARTRLMRVVFALEQALIQVLGPEKVNLASLGNQVPHLHWHVVPRFNDDPHFPFAIWGRKVREGGHPLPPAFALNMRRSIDQLLAAKRGLTKG